MKIGITIEARMGSSRLPGKTMMKVGGKPMIELMFDRASRSLLPDEVIISTSTSQKDDVLCNYLKSRDIKFFRGSEDNVLERVLLTAESNNIDIIVELCGDCPLIDPELIDRCILLFLDSDVDYVSNTTLSSRYPRGSDIQVFTTRTLRKTYESTSDPDDIENVSLYIYSNPDKFKLLSLGPPQYPVDPSDRLTVDFQEDFNLISEIVRSMGPECTLEEISAFLSRNPEIKKLNSDVHMSYINDNTRNRDGQ